MNFIQFKFGSLSESPIQIPTCFTKLDGIKANSASEFSLIELLLINYCYYRLIGLCSVISGSLKETKL